MNPNYVDLMSAASDEGKPAIQYKVCVVVAK